jgi:hypothetical protein
MSVKQDIKTVVGKSVSLPLSAAATLITMAADMLTVGESMIAGLPSSTRSVLELPFSTTKGYIMEAEGVAEDVADVRAYHYVRQPLSVTIGEVGVGSGKLLAQLLKEEAA